MWSVWSVGCSCLCCDWSAMKKTKFQHSKSCSEGCPLQPVWAFREEVFIFDWFSASPAPPKWWCHSLHCSGFGRRPRRTSVVCETFSIMRLKGLTGSLYQPQIIRHVCLSRKSQTNQRNEGFSPQSLTCSVTELWCKNTCLNPTRWSLQVTVENALLLWNYITQQPLYSRVLISWAVCCDLVCDWSHECESDIIMINMVQFSLWCFSFMYMSVMTL